MKPGVFRIPASTSNLGAGFDALGLALACYLTVEITPAASFEIVAHGVSAESIPLGENNLILRVAQRIAMRRDRVLSPVHLKIENEIPLARGLGSSAAAIIAGITCYEVANKDLLSEDDILRYACEFEPHPDNLAAALHGGLTAAATGDDGRVFVASLKVPDGIEALAVIPRFELSTEKARAVLPLMYSRKDAVYNIQRTALTTAALSSGNWGLLREAMQDRLHQPYRTPFIPGLDAILSLKTPGLAGIALSGAGPTVFAFVTVGAGKQVAKAIVDEFARHGVEASGKLLEIDVDGRKRM